MNPYHPTWAPTQVLLVSDNPVGNLASALWPALKPERVILATRLSRDLTRAHQLEQVLRQHGIQVSCMALPDTLDMTQLAQSFSTLLHGGERILLNATGGTKIHAMAAAQVFQQANMPVVYIEDGHRVHFISDGNAQPQDADLHYSLTDLLSAYGFGLKYESRATPRKAAALAMLDWPGDQLPQFPLLAKKMRDVNTSIQGSENDEIIWFDMDVLLRSLRRMHRKTFEERARDRMYISLCESLMRLGVFETNGTQYGLTRKLRRWLSGNWFEEAVFAVLDELRDELQLDDLCWGAQLFRQTHEDPAHELDVVALRNGDLYVVECKTLINPGRRSTPKSVIDNLLALRTSIGDQTRYAYAGLNGTAKWHDREFRERAAERGVLLIDKCDHASLRETFRRWMGPA